MTDREFKRIHARVRRVLEKWLTVCGLRTWRRVTIHYHQSTDAMCAARGANLTDDQRDVAGAAVVSWEYREADIHFNLSKMFSFSDEDIDYTVRHEIAHCLVSEMREWRYGNENGVAIAHEERVVTELAMVLGWTAQLGSSRKEPRRGHTGKQSRG